MLQIKASQPASQASESMSRYNPAGREFSERGRDGSKRQNSTGERRLDLVGAGVRRGCLWM